MAPLRRCLRRSTDRRRVPARRAERSSASWAALLCACLLLSGAFAISHGHALAARPDARPELDAGCRVCLQSAPLRSAAGAAALLLPLAPIERVVPGAPPSALETPRLALGHPSRAPPLA